MGARLVWGACFALVSSVAVQSCLLSPPSTIEDPQPSRPNVNINQVVPPVYQVLNAEHNGPAVNLTIPFTSVDAGQRIKALVWVNWNLEGQQVYPVQGELPPASSVGDTGMGGATSTERSMPVSWSPAITVPSGCNQLTVFLTHERNVDTRLQPIDFDKTAVVTWWVNLDALPGEEHILSDCPGPAVPTSAN